MVIVNQFVVEQVGAKVRIAILNWFFCLITILVIGDHKNEIFCDPTSFAGHLWIFHEHLHSLEEAYGKIWR